MSAINTIRCWRPERDPSGSTTTIVAVPKWWKSPGVQQWLRASDRPHNMPGWVYLVQVGWAVLLLIVFIAFVEDGNRLGFPPSLGRVPIEAPWVGAVGGLLASVGGIVRYAHGQWNPRFNYWHPIKPLMSAAAGGISCLIVVVLFDATSRGSTTPVSSTTLDVAAFVFGFAESSFRQLIKTVTDVFLKPGTSTPPATSQTVNRAGGPSGPPATTTGEVEQQSGNS